MKIKLVELKHKICQQIDALERKHLTFLSLILWNEGLKNWNMLNKGKELVKHAELGSVKKLQERREMGPLTMLTAAHTTLSILVSAPPPDITAAFNNWLYAWRTQVTKSYII